MTAIRHLGLVLGLFAAALASGCVPACDPPESSPVATREPVPIPGDPPAVTLTPRAAATVKRLIADQQTAGKLYLRLRVLPGGCQGFTHKLDLDSVATGEDRTCESAGVTIVMAARQVELLRGTRIDYGEKGGERGFMTDNPNFEGERAAENIALLAKDAGGE